MGNYIIRLLLLVIFMKGKNAEDFLHNQVVRLYQNLKL